MRPNTGNRNSTEEAVENPYLAARREWNERYGSYIKREHRWQITAVLTTLVALVAVAGVVWIGGQNRYVPYVVEVDRLGAAVAVKRADEAAAVDERVVRAQLARWISSVRTVVADVAAERELLSTAYATVEQRNAAYAKLNELYSAKSPFERAQTETVAIEVRSVLLLAGATWRVEWVETVRGRDGRVENEEQWQATVTVMVNPPSDEATILRNPMGVYVADFNWSKRV